MFCGIVNDEMTEVSLGEFRNEGDKFRGKITVAVGNR